MTDDPIITRLATSLKRGVVPSPGFDRRVLAQIARGSERRAWVRWGVGLAVPTAAALLLFLRPHTPPAPFVAVAEADPTVQFAIDLPGAASVAVVGDFNDWDRSRTPLRRQGDLWTASLPIRAGIYRFAFLVDGSTFAADPGRPPAADPDFGRPASLLTVTR